MSFAQQNPWTAERFLAWAEAQEEGYEFDGVRPVLMTGRNANHSRMGGNIRVALWERLRGTPWSILGPNLGLQTIDGSIRYPDAMITCKKFPGTDKLAPDVVVVFEVVSPTSGRLDRVEKAREYQAVPSLRRYVIVESATAAVQVLHRDSGPAAWTAGALTNADMLALPEIGIEVPVAELYEDVIWDDAVTDQFPVK